MCIRDSASAGIGAAIGAGKDADLTIDTHPLEIGSSTSAGIGAGVGGFVDPSDLSLSGGTDGSGALSASLQMNADASMPELASALSGMGAQMRAIGSQAANLSTTLQNDVQEMCIRDSPAGAQPVRRREKAPDPL